MEYLEVFNYTGVSRFFSCDTANERTLLRKNIKKQERLHEGVTQWLNCCVLSNFFMWNTQYNLPLQPSSKPLYILSL